MKENIGKKWVDATMKYERSPAVVFEALSPYTHMYDFGLPHPPCTMRTFVFFANHPFHHRQVHDAFYKKLPNIKPIEKHRKQYKKYYFIF